MLKYKPWNIVSLPVFHYWVNCFSIHNVYSFTFTAIARCSYSETQKSALLSSPNVDLSKCEQVLTETRANILSIRYTDTQFTHIVCIETNI